MEFLCLNTDEGFSLRVCRSISDYVWWGYPEHIVILFCRKGRLKMSVDSELHELSFSSLIFLSPGNLIHFIEESEDMEFVSIILSEKLLLDLTVPDLSWLLLYFKKHPCLVLQEWMQKNIESELIMLEQAYKNNKSQFKHQIIRLYIENLLMDIYDKVLRGSLLRPHRMTAVHMNGLCARFILSLQRNHISRYNLEYYAAELQVSGYYLSRVVRTIADSTVRDIINLYTLSDAKSLLRFTQLPYHRISEMFKFGNCSLFSRWFKRMTGISPSMYRKQNSDPSCLIKVCCGF